MGRIEDAEKLLSDAEAILLTLCLESIGKDAIPAKLIADVTDARLCIDFAVETLKATKELHHETCSQILP